MIWRFLTSKGCLVCYLCGACFALSYVWSVGAVVAMQDLAKIKKWLLGGAYQGYAVLSVAFAMNTWGLAVKSTRRKVKFACKKRLSSVLSKLRAQGYTKALDVRVASGGIGYFAGLWLRWLQCCISRYDKMLPDILEVSAKITEIAMCAAATAAVACMILGVNGRFAAFLLLPYPIFWIYSKLATFWVKIMLELPMLLLRISGVGQDFTFDAPLFVSTVECITEKLTGEIERK